MKRNMHCIAIFIVLIFTVSNSFAEIFLNTAGKASVKVISNTEDASPDDPPDYGPTIICNAQLIYDGYKDGNSDFVTLGTGNGDRVVNKGESIAMQITLMNTGNCDAEGVTAILRSTDPYITVDLGYSEASFGTIASNGTAQNSLGSQPYKFTVSATSPDSRGVPFASRGVPFDLTISDARGNSWSSSFIVNVQE